MVYQIIAALVALIALALLGFTIKLLGNGRWIAGFCRGVIGLLVLALSAAIGLTAQDLMSYRSASDGQTIATVSFRQQQAQQFLVEIQPVSGDYYTFDLSGEQWEVRMRTFKWPPLMTASGLELGYRFEQLQTRYYTLDKRGEGDSHQLERSKYVDVWQLLNDNQLEPFGMRSEIESLGLVSLTDGAIFDIQVVGDRLQIKPMNEAAQKAQNAW